VPTKALEPEILFNRTLRFRRGLLGKARARSSPPVER
jgi:hypothetical protein